MSWIDFARSPGIGTTVMLDDQRYELEHTRPYRRKDGEMTTLLTWRSSCPKCGQSFTVTSGLVASALNRRCASCKRASSPVSRKRGKAVSVAVAIR